MSKRTKSKHTPGPWTMEDKGDRFEVMGHGDWIATAHGGYAGDQENAILITAAPDLLWTAKHVKDWLVEHGRYMSDDVRAGYDSLADALDAAIEKATKGN